MACKKCIHYVVCSELMAQLHWKPELCRSFQDKSQIFEIPCKMGDTAWYISIERYVPLTYKIKEAKVINFRADCDGIFEFELATEKSTFLLLSEYVFFNKSKAEAKLKELNKNNCN